ncbi:MAG: NAD-dependent epimerase/dehydratase family protein [Candidatus Sulfotelmatobacter sp.]
MKILIIGASGPIGRAVAEKLSINHQILKAGRSHGDFRVDIRNHDSVSQLFKEVGMLDAIVCAAGHVQVGSAQTLTICPRLPPSGTIASAILSQGF